MNNRQSTTQTQANTNSNNNTFKSNLKTIISSHTFFNKFYEKYILSNLVDLRFVRPIVTLSDFIIGSKVDKNVQLNPRQLELLEKTFPSNYLPETEFISKPFSFYFENHFLRLILVSVYYKLFLSIHLNSNFKATCIDFYSTLSLICSDFPKSLVRKVNYIYIVIYKKTNAKYDTLSNEISLAEFFIVFCYYVFYYEFFEGLELYFQRGIVNSTSNSNQNQEEYKNLEGKPIVAPNENILKSLLNENSKTNSIDILNYFQETKAIKPPIENLLEITILSNEELTEKYELNTINTLEDAAEILNTEKTPIEYLQFLKSFFTNGNQARFFFSVDETSSKLDSVLTKLDLQELLN